VREGGWEGGGGVGSPGGGRWLMAGMRGGREGWGGDEGGWEEGGG